MPSAIPWADIVLEHGPAVWRTVYRLVADREDAAECYQEVFLEGVRLSRSRQFEKGVDNWGGLLMTIATRRGIDRLRQRVSRRRQQSSSDVSVVADRRQQSVDDVTDAELAERLRNALAVLPEHQAEAFWLSFMGQQTYDEIAEHMSLTVEHVGVLLHRARAKLRESLGQQLLEERSRP